MPTGKRKRTGTTSRRNVRRRTTSSFTKRAPVASRGFKGYLGRRSQGERNWLDTSINVAPASTAVSSVLLNYPTPGTGPTGRVGRKICIKSVQIRLNIITGVVVSGVAPAAIPGTTMRVLLVWDKQVNGAAAVPTAAELFNVIGSLPVTSPLNLDNRDRFAILMDKTFSSPNMVSTLGFPSQTSGSTSGSIYFKKFKKLNHETIFNSGTAGTQADIVSGGLYLVMCSNAQGSVTNAIESVDFIGSARIRFEDM